jgi:hypothetical protein
MANECEAICRQLSQLPTPFKTRFVKDWPQPQIRCGSAQPTSAQLAAVRALGAKVEWSQFGTPSSVIRYGGYIATGLKAPDAASAARQWLESNSTLFRLSSTDTLDLSSATRFIGTNDASAVVFRQSAGGVREAVWLCGFSALRVVS